MEISLIAANAVIRLGYGLAALTSPSTPVLGTIPLRPIRRSFRRRASSYVGFAAHQIAVAVVGLASLSRANLRRPAMLLAAAIDAADISSAVNEARTRGRLDPDLTGGIAFSAAGFASALVALPAA